MNILIPDKWLRQHLQTTATPNQVAEKLSLCGPSVERIIQDGNENIYDIEVTTNRVDSMSIRGIAREAAAILQQFGIAAQLLPLNLPPIATPQHELPLPQIINNADLCARILTVVLDNVHQSDLPTQLATNLTQAGHGTRGATIDITNYITHELGHPCHAFDYDKIMNLGGVIKVVTAEPGMKFTTLDKQTYKTVGGEVIFTNQNNEIIDLPGIIGTQNSSVDNSTKRVLLWIESILPEKIRFASMTHAIRTTAAQLNEKQIDPHLAMPVLQYGVQLYQEITGAQVASQVYDDFPGAKLNQQVITPLESIAIYLGKKLAPEHIAKLLTDLECEVIIDKENILVTPPTFRPDINISQDVIEEIARLYGYHNLGSNLMTGEIPTNYPNSNFSLEDKIKLRLASWGWQEMYTYSMVSAEVAQASGLDLNSHLAISNPLTADRVYLRQTLLPSLLEAIEQNKQHQDLSLFEIAHTYIPQHNDLPLQEPQLALATKKPYQEFINSLTNLMKTLFIEHIEIKVAAPLASYQQGGEIWAGKTNELQKIGWLGIASGNIVVAEINLTLLLQLASTYPRLAKKANTAIIKEDFTFTLPNEVLIGDVLTTLANCTPHIIQVELIAQYQRNFTFSIAWQDPHQNLSDEQIKPWRTQLITAVEKQHNAQLVGQK